MKVSLFWSIPHGQPVYCCRYTYTSDYRFKAIHKVHSEDYLLQIMPVLMSDIGTYECQISTTPIRSHYIVLNVIGKTDNKSPK